MSPKKKILVVDDSALVRRVLTKIIQEMGFEVDTAKDGIEAVEKAIKNSYDLITLDIEMPGKNGLEVLKEIMEKKPTRVIIISSYTTDNASITIQALNLGALTYITKPGKLGVDLKKVEEEIKYKIKEALEVPKFRLKSPLKTSIETEKYYEKELKSFEPDTHTQRYILIGASTGGPRLIEQIAKTLPENYPHPVCVVQHMPENFTGKFAERLNSISKLTVVEARNNEEVIKGKIIIGKGGKHLHFRKREDGVVVCKLAPNTANRFFVPSVDEMFFSALEVMEPKKIVAILLTGIGDDGADGMVALKKAGAYTIAESEETAVVYGMPREAYLRGGATKVLPFPEILREIIRLGMEEHVQKV